MAYNLNSIYQEVDKRLSANPDLQLLRLAADLCCSYATIEKAVLNCTSLSFREFKNAKRLEITHSLLIQGSGAREIATELGYKWQGNFSRFLKNSIGLSFKELRRKTGEDKS